VGFAVSATVKKISLFNTMVPLMLVITPVVLLAYSRGALSGMLDMARGRDEMDFNHW